MYASMYFSNKGNPDIQHTPFLVLHQVQLLRLLPLATQEIALYMKSWHADGESLFIVVICSDDPGLRKFVGSWK